MQYGQFFHNTGRKMSLTNIKGFTFPELLIAAVIFALAMCGILLMFISCGFLDQANRNKNIAAGHAELVMENIIDYMRSGDLTPLQGQIDAATWNWDSDDIGAKLGCASPYVYPCVLDSESITTTYVAATNPLDVTVTVSWKDRAQTNTRSINLETLISKR
jgi:prepilin-type N-terminal cleavage/methylation domain-containing protein